MTRSMVSTKYTKCVNYEKAKELLERSLKLQDRAGIGEAESLELAFTLCNLSYVYRFTTEYDKAKVAIDRCIALYKKYDPHGLNLALALSELASISVVRGIGSGASGSASDCRGSVSWRAARGSVHPVWALSSAVWLSDEPIDSGSRA